MKHEERRIIKHSPSNLYKLVADVKKYPEFLPWCLGARVKNTSLFEFIQHVNTKHKENIDSFENLHKWSVENRNYFWDEVWNFFNVLSIVPECNYFFNWCCSKFYCSFLYSRHNWFT